MAKARIGRQTPTFGVVVPYRKSFGTEAVTLYESTGRKARKWQTLLLKDIMAVTPGGLWKHTKFGLAVPRQNGKNEVVVMRELWGLQHGEHIIHTAHRTDTAHKAWERLLDRVLLADLEIVSQFKARGKEHIEVANGGKVEFRTRTSSGGLGESFDLLVYDEAQELQDDQDAALKYTIAASANPQIIYLGTPPTTNSAGVVFKNLRDQIRAGTAVDCGWAEWSVDTQRDPWDKESWYDANPSLGQGLSERTITGEIGADVLDFNIQRLGYWVTFNIKSAFTQAEWERMKCETAPELKGRAFIGIKYNKQADSVSLSIAVKTVDGRTFVETVDRRPTRDGNAWIVDFCRKIAGHAKRIVVDGSSGQQLLADELHDAKVQKPYLPTVKDVIAANALWESSIFGEKLAHMNQPALAQVVENCDRRPIGTNGGFGYKSILEEADISLMDSAILAVWAADRFAEKPSGQKLSC